MAMGRNAEAEQESQVLPRVEKASMYDRSGLTKEVYDHSQTGGAYWPRSRTPGMFSIYRLHRRISRDIIQRARGMSPEKLFKDKSKPDCFLKMTRNEVLTKAGSTKGVRHFEFQCVCSTIQYEVGDVVELLSSENPSAIDAFLEHCDLDPKSFITVGPRETENSGVNEEMIT